MMLPRINFDHLADWKQKQLQPWVWKWTDLEVKASAADGRLDYPEAEALRRQARIVKAHIERLEAL